MIKPPEYSALINPIACTAYAMRYVGRKDAAQSLPIDTGEKADGCPITAVVCDVITQSQVCDALMFMTPFVRLMTPVKPDYAAQFMMATITVVIDGETVICEEFVEKYLVMPPFRLPEVSERERAGNDILVVAGKEEEDLLGGCRLHFLPNGTRIQITLCGIPSGGGPIRIMSGALLGNYTTKAKQGCLFEVGTLDDLQQAMPSPFGWTENRGKTLSQNKIEAAYSSELKNLLEEKAKEIKRKEEELEAERNRRMEMENQILKEKEAARTEKASKRETKAVVRYVVERTEPPDGIVGCYYDLHSLEKIGEKHGPGIYRITKYDSKKSVPTEHILRIGDTYGIESEPASKGSTGLDKVLYRAKRRLIVWGLIAFLAFAVAALVVTKFSKVMSSPEKFYRIIGSK